ncbi:MAG: TSUP family transporter [Intestinibacillus sp.]
MIFIDRKTKYLITGALAGLANGFFGSGGGLFIVPLLNRWVKLDQRRAFATSVAVILPLSVVSVVIYFMKGGLDLGFAWPFLLGGAAGGLISGRIFQKIPLTLLRRAFGALILYGGVRAILLL